MDSMAGGKKHYNGKGKVNIQYSHHITLMEMTFGDVSPNGAGFAIIGAKYNTTGLVE